LKHAKRPLLSAAGCHTRLDGQHCPLRTYLGFYFKKGKKPFEHINSRFFLMNEKELKGVQAEMISSNK
jgi:hypothetical protein